AREETERLKQGEQLHTKQATLKAQLEAAARERQQAEGKAVEEKTLFERARSSLNEFQSLQGARICRHCGQPLTEGHFEEEKRKRQHEAEEAKARAHLADQTRKKAQ